jgi:NDP-sugar pyrophosphorylase family protein
MWAAILAGGKGLRLKSLARHRPKALVKLGRRTLLECVVTTLLKAQIVDIVVIVGHDSTLVTRYIRDNLRNIPIEVIENSGPGTFSAFSLLRNAHRREDFILLGCDLIFEHSTVQQLTNEWNSRPCDVLEALNIEEPLSEPVRATIDAENRMLEFGRRSAGNLYSAGLRICSPTIFKEIENADTLGVLRFTDFVAFLLHKKYDVRGLIVQQLINVNTPEEFKLAADYMRERLTSKGGI